MVNKGNNILDLHTVYDSGAEDYNTDCLWDGLAINDLNKVNPYFESSPGNDDAEQNLQYLIQAAHDRNMKVTSWINLSYFWTGSGLWQEAIIDVQNHGLDNLPEESPAKWFARDYSGDACPTEDPQKSEDFIADFKNDPDNSCTGGDQIVWRYVPQVGACVASRWALTPSVDYNSQEWQNYASNAIQKYIDMGIDGFYLDAPDQYIEDGITLEDRYNNGGYAPPNLRNIIDSAHDYGRSSYSKEIAFLSEHYGFGYKGSVFSNYIHADIGLWDYEDTESKTGAYGLPLAIINKDIPSLDDWMTGIDNAQFTCLYSSYGDDPWCPTAMQRIPVFVEGGVSSKLNALMVSLALAGGCMAAIEYVMLDSPDTFTDNIPENIYFWAPLSENYQGQNDDIPTTLERLGFNQFSDANNVFATSDALRATVIDEYNPDLYGILKYDAFETGQVSLFLANLDPSDTISVNLADPEILYQLTSDDFGFDTASLPIEPLSMEVVVGSNFIGTWFEETTTDDNGDVVGHLNCYGSHGLASNDVYEYAIEDPTTVAGCMLYYLSDSNGCESITIQWIDLFSDNSLNPGKVMCFLHSSVNDVNSCDESENPQDFSGDQYQTFSLQ